MSPEHETMRELLSYPNPDGLHPAEARWRDFARELVREYEDELTLLRQRLADLDFNDFRF